MVEGLYTIDSIKQGLVKLLWRENESIEEVIPFDKLSYPAKEGDLIEVRMVEDKLIFTHNSTKTVAIQEQARKLKEKLQEKINKAKKLYQFIVDAVFLLELFYYGRFLYIYLNAL